MTNNELKPCPFCGGEASLTIRKHTRDQKTFYMVGCEKISCLGTPHYASADKDAFIAKWNTRACASDGCSSSPRPSPPGEGGLLVAAVGALDGVGLIAQERERQQAVEGYTADHDNTHDKGELALVAGCYAFTSVTVQCYPNEWANFPPLTAFPWEIEDWKPSGDPIRNLVKAGALIVAEIERLQRKGCASGLVGAVSRQDEGNPKEVL